MIRKRDRTSSSHETAPLNAKRQKPDDDRLERKRAHDRTAQRAVREKTRNRIAQLEALVQALQADNESDGKIGNLLAQLDEKTAEVNRLRSALDSINKITNGARKPMQNQINSTGTSGVGVEPIETPLGAPVIETSYDTASGETTSTFTSLAVTSNANNKSPPFLTSCQDVVRTGALEVASPTPSLAVSLQNLSEGVKSDIDEVNDLSISQIASAITGNLKLEGRLWYLAGTILNHLLKLPQQSLYTTIFDEDIAIRAVIEGWSAVMERYPLDRGWQWLKELDETIYFNSGKPERLMHLRNCRYQFLHQMFPDSEWNQKLPAFFTARPSQRYLHHDPLIEHFPWPSFRERLLFFPSKYATNKFMETLRGNLHFVWGYSPHELYKRDPYSEVYSYSDTFTKHAMDIRCYSVKPVLFDHFPELREDIPYNDASPFHNLLTYTPLDSTETSLATEEYFSTRESLQEKDGELIESVIS